MQLTAGLVLLAILAAGAALSLARRGKLDVSSLSQLTGNFRKSAREAQGSRIEVLSRVPAAQGSWLVLARVEDKKVLVLVGSQGGPLLTWSDQEAKPQ